MSDAPLAALAVQYWKLCDAFGRELEHAHADRVQAGEAQLRFARRKLEAILSEAGLRLITYEGARFTPDIPASPVNAEDIGSDAEAIVATTIEPTITSEVGVLIAGKILLKEA
jgi:hypothetical protein